MNLSEESQSIRTALGEFFQEVAFIERRWVRLDSCTNTTFTPKGGTPEIPHPVPALSDILGVHARVANDYLVAAGLLVAQRSHGTLCPNKKAWDGLKAQYQLDIELEQARDAKCLGPDRLYFLCIGCLGPHKSNCTTFTAKDQAKRYLFGDTTKHYIYEKGWQPKRMRTARQQNEFACSTSLDLAIYLVKKTNLDDDHKEDDDDDDDDEVDETRTVVDSSSTA